MPLRNIVKSKLVSCRVDTPVCDIAQMMDSENVGAVLIVEENKPVGIVTDRDLTIRCLARRLDPAVTTAREVMTSTVETVSEDQGIFTAIRAMKNGMVRRIAIVNEAGSVTTLLSFDDLFTLVADEIQDLRDLIRPSDAKWTRQVA